jgi:diguanylate cyclase (GGDEF)-like protein
MLAGPPAEAHEPTNWPALAHHVGTEAPVAMLVMNDQGAVVWANAEALQVVDPFANDLIGRPVMDLVHQDDWLTVVASLEYSDECPGKSVGPIRVRYSGGSAVVRRANLWAKNMMDDPAIRGIVISWVPDVSHQVLADAVSSATAGNPLAETLAVLVRSTLAVPFNSPSSILEIDPETGEVLRNVSSAGAPHFLQGTDTDLPWVRAAQLGMAVNAADLGTYGARYQPSRTGFASVWCRPIPSNTASTGVLAVWRPTTRGLDPSQHQELDRIVDVAQLCIESAANHDLLRYMASHDRLTGVANREWLQTFDSPLFGTSALFVDLDDFKGVNDRFGHLVGDEVLQVVARRLLGAVRSEDLVTRYGGDEFVVVCRTPTKLAETEAIAARIAAVLQEPISVKQHQISISASIGIAIGDPHGSLVDLVAQAEHATPRVNESTRGTYTLA